ncbi:MAG: hypothetical protein ACM31D_02640 [Bacteroidota bacterium]
MNVIAFPRVERREHQLRAIEQCLDALCAEADDLGLEMLAHMIAVAREAACEALDEERSR